MPDGPGRFTQDSSCPALLRVPASAVCLRVRVCHPLRRSFPARFRFAHCRFRRPYNPRRASTPPVWAPALSLATTQAITFVFSSSAYLDVSVQRVSSYTVPLARRVPPFGHPRINGHLRLPAAFRSLSRPSSPLRAKASSVRS